MSDRITTTCSHSHTVTLRLNEGEPWSEVKLDSGRNLWVMHGADQTWSLHLGKRDHHWHGGPYPCHACLRAELEAALAAAEASCGGCGCADRLRAEARDLAAVAQECIEAGNERVAKIADAKSVGHFCAADFHGHAKKRAEWNDPKEATDG